MDLSKKSYMSNFFQLMGAIFLMFFIAAILGKPTVDLVVKMNDKNLETTIVEQIFFWGGACIFTGTWALIWVWFKKSEKVCVEYWLNKPAK